MKKQAFGEAAAPLTPVIKLGNVVIVSGQVPVNGAGQIVGSNVSEQTEAVLANLKAQLERAGASLSDVVKTTVILTNIKRDFGAMNGVYAQHFPDPKPARTTLGAELAIDILVEIEAIAVMTESN